MHVHIYIQCQGRPRSDYVGPLALQFSGNPWETMEHPRRIPSLIGRVWMEGIVRAAHNSGDGLYR